MIEELLIRKGKCCVKTFFSIIGPILAPIAETPQILSSATHCIRSDGTRHALNEEYEEVRDDGVKRICICELHERGTRTTCRIKGRLNLNQNME